MNCIEILKFSFIGRPFNHLPLYGVGMEIGVDTGKHAKELLMKHGSNIRVLHLVDPYLAYDEPGRTQDACNKARAVAIDTLSARFGQRVKFCRGNIEQWAKDNRDICLDFCYIDGNHAYEFVKNDIATIWPRIKHGGILGGHDFHRDWPGVIKAVTEFSVGYNLTLNVEHTDWWVIKL